MTGSTARPEPKERASKAASGRSAKKRSNLLPSSMSLPSEDPWDSSSRNWTHCHWASIKSETSLPQPFLRNTLDSVEDSLRTSTGYRNFGVGNSELRSSSVTVCNKVDAKWVVYRSGLVLKAAQHHATHFMDKTNACQSLSASCSLSDCFPNTTLRLCCVRVSTNWCHTSKLWLEFPETFVNINSWSARSRNAELLSTWEKFTDTVVSFLNNSSKMSTPLRPNTFSIISLLPSTSFTAMSSDFPSVFLMAAVLFMCSKIPDSIMAALWVLPSDA